MSTFEGKLLEDSLDFIRIDQFEPKNHNGTVFFLSHFHTDHFKGLFSDAFLKVLIDNEDKVVYCTDKTKNCILRHDRCRIPERKIYALTVNDPIVVAHEGRQSVQVRAIPAGHCPGSVMFLFEQEATRVLYTGDFRINPNELHKFKAFHNSDGSVKKINRLYLDTTFCDPRWISFPSRKQSEEDLIKIAREWLESNADHRVGILYNSYYGLEHLLMRVAKFLKTKIWVRDFQSYVIYSCIPELHAALCEGETNAKVHLCRVKQMGNCDVCCRDRNKVKTIKPCAQSFDSDQLELGRQKEGENNLVRIAYSMHCSLEELIGTVNYLKPDAVHPCALPRNVSELQVLKNLRLDVDKVKQQMKEKRERTESDCSGSPPAKKFCLSGTPEEWEEEEDEKEIMLEIKEHSVVSFSSDDEEENIPLSQTSIDSPPL